MEHITQSESSKQKHQQAVNSSVIIDSPNHNNNTQHLIAPTHSNNIRLTPKKFDMELASHRPVLHKYSPAQVEIIYHRKSGESEVVGVKKTKSKKNTTPKSSKLRSADQSLLEKSADKLDQHYHPYLIEDLSFTEQDTTTTTTTNNHSILSLNDSRNGIDSSSSVLTTNNDLLTEQHRVIVETVRSVSTMTLTDTPDDEQMNAECRELIDELWSVIESMKLEILDLHSRVGTLESTIMNDMQVLKAQRQKHLLSSKAIADDMQRMQNKLNNSNEWKRIEEEVDHLLKRAKRAHTGSSKTSVNHIIKPIGKEN